MNHLSIPPICAPRFRISCAHPLKSSFRTIFVAALLPILSATAFSQDSKVFSSLFNGKDLTQWTMLPDKTPAFAVVDGFLETKPCNGSDLFSVENFGNYVFRFEYLLSKVGNSGVLIRCDPKNPWTTGMEVQLLAPWTPHRDDLHCTGSIYGYAPVTHRPDETTGVWHQMEITCDRKTITISVNGETATTANTDLVAGLKDKQLSGRIGLQANHSNEGEFARFRNLTIRNLDAEPAYVKAGFHDADVRIRTLAQAAAVALGPKMIGPLAGMMDDENIMARTGAKQALFDITAKATAPQTSSADQQAVAHSLQAGLDAKPSAVTTAYLNWLLAMISSSEH